MNFYAHIEPYGTIAVGVLVSVIVLLVARRVHRERKRRQFVDRWITVEGA